MKYGAGADLQVLARSRIHNSGQPFSLGQMLTNRQNSEIRLQSLRRRVLERKSVHKRHRHQSRYLRGIVIGLNPFNGQKTSGESNHWPEDLMEKCTKKPLQRLEDLRKSNGVISRAAPKSAGSIAFANSYTATYDRSLLTTTNNIHSEQLEANLK